MQTNTSIKNAKNIPIVVASFLFWVCNFYFSLNYPIFSLQELNFLNFLLNVMAYTAISALSLAINYYLFKKYLNSATKKHIIGKRGIK